MMIHNKINKNHLKIRVFNSKIYYNIIKVLVIIKVKIMIILLLWTLKIIKLNNKKMDNYNKILYMNLLHNKVDKNNSKKIKIIKIIQIIKV
jgi:hypothetical protein